MHLSNVVFKVEENHKTNGAQKGSIIWNSAGSGGSVWWITFIVVDIRPTYMYQRFLHIQMHNSYGNIFIWLYCFEKNTSSPFPPFGINIGTFK